MKVFDRNSNKEKKFLKCCENWSVGSLGFSWNWAIVGFWQKKNLVDNFLNLHHFWWHFGSSIYFFGYFLTSSHLCRLFHQESIAFHIENKIFFNKNPNFGAFNSKLPKKNRCLLGKVDHVEFNLSSFLNWIKNFSITFICYSKSFSPTKLRIIRKTLKLRFFYRAPLQLKMHFVNSWKIIFSRFPRSKLDFEVLLK